MKKKNKCVGVTGFKGNLGSNFINRYKKKYRFVKFRGRIDNFKKLIQNLLPDTLSKK